MNKLESALAWAKMGLPVFPLVENSKEPLFKGWTEKATTDPKQIEEWWKCPISNSIQDYNIGCCTTDYAVIDIDVKAGKHGLESFESLGLTFDTLTVRTPTGGLHCYYLGETTNRAEILGPGSGLDIRGHHGFVVAPGSTIDGVPYEVLHGLPIGWAPEILFPFFRAPGARNASGTGIADDNEIEVERAREWLLGAPIAVEGQGGDDTTYKICSRLTRDFGLTVDGAFALLLEQWNPRCEPPWLEDELFAKVEHAAQYGQNEIGSGTLDAALAGIDFDEDTITIGNADKPAKGLSNSPTGLSRLTTGLRITRDQLKAREWMYQPLLMRKKVTQITATGAGGKSTFALTMAIHGALGLPFLGHKLHDGPFRSIVYNAEDDLDEQYRRLFAICDLFGFDAEEVGKNIILFSEKDCAIKLTKGDKGEPNLEQMEELMRLCKKERIDFLAMGPLVKLHTVSENDNVLMDEVMSVLNIIADKMDIAVLIDHHTSKPSANRMAGDVNAGRGASSIATNCRINLMLSGMTAEEAEQHGVSDEDRPRFVRLDDSKMNLTLRRGKPLWLKMHSLDIPGKGRLGDTKVDSVGVPQMHDLDVDLSGVTKVMADTIEQQLIEHNTGHATIREAATYLALADSMMYGMLAEKTVMQRIEAYLRSPIVTSSGAVLNIDKDEKGRKVVTFKQ